MSGIATGGHQEAREFFLPIDQAVSSGELILPIPVDVTETKIKKKSKKTKVNKSNMRPPEHEIY